MRRSYSYGITSLEETAASARDLLVLQGGHWQVESANHYRRDTTFRGDSSRVRTGHGPAYAAALNNLALALLLPQRQFATVPETQTYYTGVWLGVKWSLCAPTANTCRTALYTPLGVSGHPSMARFPSTDRRSPRVQTQVGSPPPASQKGISGRCERGTLSRLPHGRAGVSVNRVPTLEVLGWGTAEHWMRMRASHGLAQARRERAARERRAHVNITRPTLAAVPWNGKPLRWLSLFQLPANQALPSSLQGHGHSTRRERRRKGVRRTINAGASCREQAPLACASCSVAVSRSLILRTRHRDRRLSPRLRIRSRAARSAMPESYGLKLRREHSITQKSARQHG